METIADLIEAARKRTGATYTDISERLDRSKQLINNWKSGKKVPTDGDVLALARMAGENADKWLAIAQAARTEGEAKTRWEQIARRLSMAAMTLVVWVGLASPAPVQAAEKAFQAPTVYTLCEILYPLTSQRGLAGYRSGSPLACLNVHPAKTRSRHDRQLQHRPQATVLADRRTMPERLRGR